MTRASVPTYQCPCRMLAVYPPLKYNVTVGQGPVFMKERSNRERGVNKVDVSNAVLIIITVYEPKPPKWVTPTQRGGRG